MFGLMSLVFILSVNIITAQSTNLKSIKIDSNKTAADYYSLPTVKTSKYKTHFSLRRDKQIIHVYLDDTNYKALVCNRISRYDGNKKVIEFSTIDSLKGSKIDSITSIIISSYYKVLKPYNILEREKAIFLDCGGLSLEFKNKNEFNSLGYTCPWAQDSLEDYNAISEHYSLIYKTFKLDSLYNVFTSKLEGGHTYSYDGFRFSYYFTDKEIELWEKDKPRRMYLDSLKDTINYIINRQLKKNGILYSKL